MASAKRPRKAPTTKGDPTAQVHELQQRLEAALAERDKTLEQQTATSEILRVISQSPSDVQPVFEAIVQSASRLCGGEYAIVTRYDGELLHLAAYYNARPGTASSTERLFPRRLGRDVASARTVLECAVVHIPDAAQDSDIAPDVAAIAPSVLAVPMIRDGVPIGAIGVSRGVPGSFAPEQIALLQTFADQAVIAIENVRLFNETKEALEQQTATADILRVISSSPMDVQPVFDAIVRSGARLCEADYGFLARYDGTSMAIVAHSGATDEEIKVVLRVYPMAPTPDSLGGRTILERAVVHIPDVRRDPTYGPRVIQDAGWRTGLGVPLLRESTAIGLVGMWRRDVRPFTGKQISLLQTFADQAVIAIENVRLFTELQEKNRALTAAHAEVTETLEQQTAMAEILEVISTSPTHLQPVLDAVVKSAARFCAAPDASIFRLDGENLRADAHHGLVFQPRGFLVPVVRGTVAGRSVLERQAVSVTDLQAETEKFPEGSSLARQTGQRATLSAPLLREGAPIGVILLRRVEAVPFTGKQIALLKTFADQAVIAIENVRLFTELQEKNRALSDANAQVTEALEQQTATSEILRTIAHTQTDTQPVFDTIVRSAAQLCHAAVAAVFLTDGRMVYHPANYGGSPEALAATRGRFPRPLDMDTMPGMAMLTRAVVNLPDIEGPSVTEHVRQVGRVLGFRSALAVPMLREGEAVGAITAHRREPGRFANAEVELLKTFADQAVIAIENVRLFNELEVRTQELTRSVGELRALGEVGQAISSTLDLQTVLSTIVARATQLSGTDAGVIYEYDEHREIFLPRATEHLEADVVETMLATPVRKGEGATGRLAEVQEPIEVPDILAAPAESRVRGALVRAGYRALLAVPLVREEHLLGGLTVIRKAPGAFAPEVIELLRTFGTQSSLAIQNARLFLEIEAKSRQLEAASRHKSEFLANMSHELRTPLNAVIGFSEVLADGMFGEINEKQTEYLNDILESGRHLLSLINDILDLSKIEAGRMELEATDFDLPSAIENALILVRERAIRRGITLDRSIDERLGTIRADERKVKQVLLNLLSNALKFTPERGRIDVRAGLHDEVAEISVVDTGVGIAAKDHEAVFEEFRQVGAAAKKVEGTGLGLALSRKFIELHGGLIWVKSEVGAGSTFTFTLPLRVPAQ